MGSSPPAVLGANPFFAFVDLDLSGVGVSAAFRASSAKAWYADWPLGCDPRGLEAGFSWARPVRGSKLVHPPGI